MDGLSGLDQRFKGLRFHAPGFSGILNDGAKGGQFEVHQQAQWNHSLRAHHARFDTVTILHAYDF